MNNIYITLRDNFKRKFMGIFVYMYDRIITDTLNSITVQW